MVMRQEPSPTIPAGLSQNILVRLIRLKFRNAATHTHAHSHTEIAKHDEL